VLAAGKGKLKSFSGETQSILLLAKGLGSPDIHSQI
tara:strand:+ start:457 stop:564 length:108 start_codon:yes stop_codon:yes gene_type:complete